MSGKILDHDGKPVSDVQIQMLKADLVTFSDSLGNYTLEVPSGKKIFFKASVVGYETEPFNVTLQPGEHLVRNVFIEQNNTMLGVVEVKDERIRGEVGTIGVNTENVDQLPSTVGGIEGQLKVLVGSRNELTSQYTVRGGNFDENLVYVNDFEINRPFLVRSGQQEGLSFVNSDLVSSVNFSVGGFQARYGDKMSSVLDVTYKKPKSFSGSAMASLLGFQAHLAGASKNKKLSYLVGFRQKSNRYLLQSQVTKGQYNPSFSDFQALLNYKISRKFEIEFIGNYALNRFRFEPESSRTAFGSVTQALAFNVRYEGSEIDQFDNAFGGISLTFKPNKRWRLKLLGSVFQSNEQETFDIMSEYQLSLVELDLGSANLGKDKISLGSGAIHRFARNFLNANVANVGLKGAYDGGNHYLSFGADMTHVAINDRLMEWERRDSAGFSIPYDPYQVNMYQSYRANNKLEYNKASAYVQDNILLNKQRDMILSLGLRATYTFLNKEMILSPRANFSFKPDWEENIIFKIAGGIYAQPPFYREMRALDGTLNTDLKAQKSAHFAAGTDYNFIALGNRPFKLTAEVYYKSLWDLVPYEYDNVRIRYAANNNGKGYAYGGEVRLFGDLVKDAESWVSLGYLKTMERILDPATNTYGDYKPRPTDGRVTFGVFFSDYLPQNHNFKVYLNMMYATGLPVPPPGFTFNKVESFRLPDYKRVDIGFSALLLDGVKNPARAYSIFKGVKSVWASLEVFNLLGISNTLSYEYIQSLNTDMNFYIPNRLTSRLINFKIAAKF
ncbi:carboxypeptidase-like regulatory domain-containing protein [Taibaiella sp. KBW10]|uniref:TonB-dependent receptor n=1 Tax=Taibaiella sp. KBW10 TaxID=2153357 RepID=UPI0013153EE8|nr:carboxypeptidase-like regulatory domain-containing protein [Taibaiella sp. KBW10]